MAARLRAYDWNGSELGPCASWPHSLILALNICLDSHFPIAVWWGPRLIQFYNDAYQPILGDEKDVHAFGGAAIDSWLEIWPTIGPMVEQVMHQGKAVKGEDLPLHIYRRGVLGLAHFTFSYSPIRDETGAIVGMFTAAVETTERVALERRQAFRLKLAEDLRQVSRPEAAIRTGGDLLRNYLDADYIGFDGLERIDPGLRAVLEGGNPVRIDRLDPASGAAQLALPGAPGLASLLLLPVITEGRLTSALSIGKHTPYRWTDADVLATQESLDQVQAVLSRLRAEQLVRKQLASEVERLRSLFDQAPSFIAVTRGPEHVYELANAAYLLMVGRRDILGMPVPAVLPELTEQGYNELLDQVYATGVPYIAHGVPVRFQRTPGAGLEELILDFIFQPVTDAEGKITGVLIEGSDVTRQHRAQAELRRERDQSQHLLSSMKEGFAIVDRDWTIRQINDEGLRIAQRSREEVIGKNHWDIWPDVRGTEVEAMYRRVLDTRTAEMNEVLITQPDGRSIWMEVRAYPALDDGLAFFFRDITERKTAQQQLRDADKRKDEFLAMLAHELRNPLAPISAAADLLRMTQVDEARLRQTSGIITRQVKHMTSLVNDLMDVSRVTRGLVTLQHELLDAKQIVADAVEQTRPLIEARRHSLDVHTPSEAAFVQGDQKRLVQVLTNLLNNAAKYTPEGGAIALSMNVRAGVVHFSVRDNCIGMEPALMAKVFELFMQAERSSDRAQGGLGIGLALVKSLVELHKGSVSVHSGGVGHGSEFTVTLPRVVKHGDAGQAPESIAPSPAAYCLRIMIVDDNVDAAQMLAMFLEAAGHQVLIEHSPHAALERMRGDSVDVFLLDIGLPQMDGYELAQRLRQQAGGAKARFIAVTGYGQEADRSASMHAGFSYHFVKPVDAPKLAGLLATLAAQVH
jgi:PAS domain S-box-containing protein